jgi:hypothetical protein
MMTHVFFDSDKIDWGPYLEKQQVGQGSRMVGRGNSLGNEDYFKGLRYVRGYGVSTRGGGAVKNVLGSIGRFLLPIATNLAESAGKEAGALIGRVHGDMAEGRPLLGSLKEQTKKGLENIGQKVQQCGRGQRKIKDQKRLVAKNIKTIPKPSNITKRKPRDYLDLV